MKKPRFTIAAILILAAIVAAFFSGRQSTVPRQRMLQAEAQEQRLHAQAHAENARNDAFAMRMLTRMRAQTTNGRANEIWLVAWNVESGGNDPRVIDAQLASFKARYDIFGLTEVSPSNTRRYLDSIRGHEAFNSITTATGHGDRMMMVYNSSRVQLLESNELDAHAGVRLNDVDFRHRSPLAAKFRDRFSGIKCIVVLNHLARGNAELRQEQAKGLRLWAADQDVPVLAIGDYNFDFDFPTRKGNKAFEEFLRDGTWSWIEPDELVDTNWADDGDDDYPDSCLGLRIHRQR